MTLQDIQDQVDSQLAILKKIENSAQLTVDSYAAALKEAREVSSQDLQFGGLPSVTAYFKTLYDGSRHASDILGWTRIARILLNVWAMNSPMYLSVGKPLKPFPVLRKELLDFYATL